MVCSVTCGTAIAHLVIEEKRAAIIEMLTHQTERLSRTKY